MHSKNGSRTVDVAEAAEQLGISRGAAYRAARTGQLPSVRLGRRVLVPVRALDRLLDGQPAPEPALGAYTEEN